ncbi:hypothetical protein ACFWNQ_26940 [Streptomyces virginiae]|uniref:hypothetical protein n=1 Tax=Streptomyces virginiae TaxID=1961 RepID=UPI0036676A9E
MTCHTCGAPMYEDSGTAGKWWCRCGSWRLQSETAEDVTAREAETARVMALLDAAIGESEERTGAKVQRDTDRQTTDEMESTMGQTIQTCGCPQCGGTMYRTVEVDENHQPIGMGPYVCSNCGHMAG